MTKKYKLPIFLAMTIILLWSVSTIEIFSQVKSKTKKTEESNRAVLPNGRWTISIHPYQDDNFSPVFLYSVSSNNARAERFDIQNISDKPVRAIKVSWLLYKDDDRSKSIRQGTTELLRFRNELPSAQNGFVKFRVVAFTDISNQLLVNNRLNGDFDIDLRVEEVHFSDGSIWQRSTGRSSDINPELETHITDSFDCARQKCVGNPSKEVRDGVTYSCGASNASERCVVNGDYACTNQSCNSGGGGYEIILD